MQINEEITTEMVKQFNRGEQVLIIENEDFKLAMNKDKSNVHNFRKKGKKYGCYTLPKREISALNNGEKIFFYNGIHQVYLTKKGEGDLQ